METGSSSSNVPTLLIGLGGIGSTVTEQVYNRIPLDRRESVAVHAFDTDINDISQRASLKNRITQTSQDMTVGDYLRRSDDSVKEWFPYEIRELHRKTLTEGAGQIRCVSRLAYRAAMQSGKLNNFESQIGNVLKAKGAESVSSIRVMVVCSLAGGTGAGMFLQTALYLRHLLEKKFQKTSILLRGAFLLPETLVYTQLVPENQFDNVRANAYASLKELDAITRNANDQLRNNQDVNIEFEYRPDQIDVEGRREYIISSENMPYDFCFLYNMLTDRGENLGRDFENYLEQMVNSVYHQLFSPIEKNEISTEDNHILSLIQGQGANRYCGSGTAKLIYPYTDIVDYLALRWAGQSLSLEWRRLDEDYNDELKDYERDLNSGVSRPKPELSTRYIKLLDQYAAGSNPNPFFLRMYYSTRIMDENGREVDSKSNKFIQGLLDKMLATLNNDRELNQRLKDCELDEGALETREKASDQIVQMENNLENLKQYIFRIVHEHKNYIINQAIGEDCRSSAIKSNEDHKLSSWMLNRDNAVHPVAVRYILYQIMEILDKHLGSLKRENDLLRRSIDGYKSKFDLPETEDYIESAEDRIRQALNQPVFKRIFKNEFKEFIEEYQSETVQQVQRLNRYKEDYLKELVFSELKEHIKEMIRHWERFFENIKTVQLRIKNESNQRAKEHEEKSDPTRKYVFASKEAKDRLWEEIYPSLRAGYSLPEDIAESIYNGLYQEFCRKYQQRFGTAEQEVTFNTEKIFRSRVLEWCRKDIRTKESLNMNLIGALKKEAEFWGQDVSNYVRGGIKQIDNLARPCIKPWGEKGNSKAWWGINPDLLHELSEQDQQDLFGNEQVVDQAFSAYELIRYRNVYGLFAEDLPDFSAGSRDGGIDPGIYYRAYKKRLNLMAGSNNNMVTPHLDKRWHLPAYMPDLNEETARADQEKTERAFVLGLIHGRLTRVKPDATWIWECCTESGRNKLTAEGRDIPAQFYDCYQALFFNPARVDGIIKYAEQQQKEDFRNKRGQLKDHDFIQGCYTSVSDISEGKKLNILDCIFKFVEEAPDKDLRNDLEILLKLLMQEIKEYYIKGFGQHQEDRAKQAASQMIDTLIDYSVKYKQEKDNQTYYYDRWKEVFEEFSKRQLGNDLANL